MLSAFLANNGQDLESDTRLACMFHADDPICFASSKGAMQCLQEAVSSWALEVGAAFHVGPQKSVGMVAESRVACDAALTFKGGGLAFVTAHRWLGVPWSANHGKRAFRDQGGHSAGHGSLALLYGK